MSITQAQAQALADKYVQAVATYYGMPVPPGLVVKVGATESGRTQVAGNVITIPPNFDASKAPAFMVFELSNFVLHAVTNPNDQHPYTGAGDSTPTIALGETAARHILGDDKVPSYWINDHTNQFLAAGPSQFQHAAASVQQGTFQMRDLAGTAGSQPSVFTPQPGPNSEQPASVGAAGGAGGGAGVATPDAAGKTAFDAVGQNIVSYMLQQLFAGNIHMDNLNPQAQAAVLYGMNTQFPSPDKKLYDATSVIPAITAVGTQYGWTGIPPLTQGHIPGTYLQNSPSSTNGTGINIPKNILNGSTNTNTGASRATYSTVIDRLQMPMDNSMHDLVTKALKAGWSTNQFLQAVRRSPEYAAFFPGIIGPNGAPIMSEAAYNSQVSSRMGLAGQYGQTLTRNQIGHELTNNVSAAELNTRLQAEQSLSQNKVYFDQFNKTLAAQGMKPLDAAGQRAFVMNQASPEYYKVWNEAATRAAAVNSGIAIGPRADSGHLGDTALTRGEIRYGEKTSLATTGKLPTTAQYADLASKLKLLPQSRLYGGGLNRDKINEIEFGGPHQAKYIDMANQLLQNEDARAKGTGAITQSQSAIGQRQAGTAEGF